MRKGNHRNIIDPGCCWISMHLSRWRNITIFPNDKTKMNNIIANFRRTTRATTNRRRRTFEASFYNSKWNQGFFHNTWRWLRWATTDPEEQTFNGAWRVPRCEHPTIIYLYVRNLHFFVVFGRFILIYSTCLFIFAADAIFNCLQIRNVKGKSRDSRVGL